jgi:hypothetical protein
MLHNELDELGPGPGLSLNLKKKIEKKVKKLKKK